MAYLSLHKTRDDIFLYGCSSLRTVKGPRCIQQCLGKVDKISLKITINSNFSSWIANNNINNDYINHFLIKHSLKGLIEEINIDIINNLINDNCISAIDTNTPTNENKVIKYCDDDILTSKVESIGLIYLLNNIANSIGLTNILQNVFPNSWEKILILAQYQVATHSPFLYLQHWAQNNSLPVESNKLASQRISELLKTISIDDIYSFYYQWYNYRQENKFLACDITSISSYSSKISDVAYGYNRDKENLKQINLCLLFGEESGLPVFSVEYNGSLNDVKTFHTIIAQLDILKNSKYKLVLDKGFYSTNNIDYMISKVISFLIAVPVKSNYVKSIIEENYNLEDDFNSSFIIGDDIMFCTTNYIKLDNKKLYGHLFLNLNTKNSNKSIIIRKANQMLEEATMNQNKYINDSAYKNVLSFKKSFKSLTGYYVKIKSNLLTNMGHESYLFLLSDVISDPKIALTIY